jgi:hypothetical protein
MTDETGPETDLEKQLEEIEQGIKAPELPDFDDNFEGKLAEIEQRSRARKKQARAEHDFAFREERGKERYNDTGKSLMVGVVFAIIFVVIVLGRDKK